MLLAQWAGYIKAAKFWDFVFHSNFFCVIDNLFLNKNFRFFCAVFYYLSVTLFQDRCFDIFRVAYCLLSLNDDLSWHIGWSWDVTKANMSLRVWHVALQGACASD